MRELNNEILMYQTEDGATKIEVRYQDETVWLSLNQMAELFQRDKSVISRHINNVYKEGELEPSATVANFATVQKDSGTVSHAMALEKARQEYERYRERTKDLLTPVEKHFLKAEKELKQLVKKVKQ